MRSSSSHSRNEDDAEQEEPNRIQNYEDTPESENYILVCVLLKFLINLFIKI